MENPSAKRTDKLSKYLPPGARRLLLALLALGLLVIPALSLLGSVAPAHAASPPPLGTAATFAVLGATTVTNTGATVVTGDLGVSPGTSCTGFPAPCTGGPGTVTGTIHAGDATAAQAQTDAHTAYANAAGQTCNTNLTGQNLGGLTLTPGVYCFNTSAQLTGTLTLNAQGNPNAVFIFQMGSTLTTATNSSVVLINGVPPCNNDNIFWQVGSSATLGTGTSFIGNILAEIAITATTGAATNNGSLYALTGAVTLDTNKINVCPAQTPPPSPTPTLPPVPTYPADGAFALGDVSAANSLNTGSTVVWWSSVWSKLNILSGGPAPARYGGPNSPRFQGYMSVDHPLPACGVNFREPPDEAPPTSVPQFMLVVVTNKITRTGTDTLTGKIIEIVIVKTDPGYNGNPNNPGTGTVIGVFCTTIAPS